MDGKELLDHVKQYLLDRGYKCASIGPIEIIFAGTKSLATGDRISIDIKDLTGGLKK